MDSTSWENRYGETEPGDIPPPAGLLQRHDGLYAGGLALDIAMGAGRNAVYLSLQGYTVIGVDRSPAAARLACGHARHRGGGVSAVVCDMLEFEIKPACYDLIANFYYLERSIIERMKRGLKQGGLLFFETYTLEQTRFGGPKNRDFLLKPNELLELFSDLLIVFYHERSESDRAVASLVARKL